MFAASTEVVVRVACIVVAVLGLLALLGAMVGFEQHRRGRVAMLGVGALLVVASAGAAAWSAWLV